MTPSSHTDLTLSLATFSRSTIYTCTYAYHISTTILVSCDGSPVLTPYPDQL